jgi:formimidoylglutamate deiminase
MARLFQMEFVLLPQGWVREAQVAVDDDGLILRIDVPRAGAAATPGAAAESIRGFVVPGMSNAHSHAFQRAMAGNTEFRLSAHDSFWTWRQAMYALAGRITPEDLKLLATQLFVEMLKAGYTAVAEFHYIHRRPDGEAYTGSNALWDSIASAAEDAGIALTFLPTLYQTGDFGAAPLKPEQSRFSLETDHFLRAVEARVREDAGVRSRSRRTGVAFHSLRAVPLPELVRATRALQAIDPDLPVHIHVAEQVKEVESCLAHTGRRPIELLLDTGLLDRRWCLVHATHSTAAELAGIADAGASVCVSITTEANLGDGYFDAARFLKLGGRMCIGSDSQSTVCPAEELRWMEYQARLRKKRRGVLADPAQSHVGTRLWRETAREGARAIGQPAGTIEVGTRADWLVLDAAHPSMAGAGDESALDHLVFAGGTRSICDVMVAGRWVVRGGRHAADAELAGPFAALMCRLNVG